MSNVYFVLVGDKIKIGFTSDIKRRMKEIKVTSAETPVLLGLIPGGKSEEKAIHQLFHQYKTRYFGEWFSTNQEILDYINENNTMSVYIERDEKGIVRVYTKIKS